MASHFNSIGFTVNTEHDFVGTVGRACREGAAVGVSGGGGEDGGRYVVWSPGQGVELWAQLGRDGRVIGCNPHFAGRGRMRISVTETHPDPEHPLDGGLYGWAAPEDDERPDSGDYPVLIDLPDFRRVAPQLRDCARSPRTLTLQVAAFAHELTLFESEVEYDAHLSSEKLKFAAESFLPSGLFRPEPAPPLAHAIFTGRILEWERRANPATGAPFYCLLVRTLGGVFDIVAEPALVEVTPSVGGVIRGSFWLSGRVVEGLPARPPGASGVPSRAEDRLRFGNFARGRGGVPV